MMITLWLRITAALLAVAAVIPASPSAIAGMGPENLIVAVNADSVDSRTVANHYIELRKIPSRNVILLRDVPAEQITTLEIFRDLILKPLLAEIDARGLSAQINGVAYSTGFPYGVRIDEHRKRLGDATAEKIFTPVASLNGLTYFYRFVIADREDYLSSGPNLYARMPWAHHFANPFSGGWRDQFDQATAASAEARHADAAAIYTELFAANPDQAPLAVLAARAYAQAGDQVAAQRQIEAAALAGWTSGSALAEDPDLESLRESAAFQQLVDSLSDAPALSQHPVAFEGSRGWTPNGWSLRPDQGGVTYLPAFLLAVTRGQGTTVDEAVIYLTRSVSADHSFPTGTVYLTSTSDVRTKTRKPHFVDTMLCLNWLDRPVKVVSTTLPEGKDDVVGITLGSANFDWAASGSTFLPGALADNLTSTGGAMSHPGQTKLTELLKAGAAAASGTVTEPYALQFKFPLPQMHSYYAAGLTAIEAYYSAVANPYQLLIVGDPLCQPFVRPPVEVVRTKLEEVEGTPAVVVRMVPADTAGQADDALDRHSKISKMEFYLDGKLVQRTGPVNTVRMKLDGISGGAYEFRTVLVGEPRLSPRKTFLSWIEVPSLLPTPTATVHDREMAGMVVVDVEAGGADSIRLMHFDQEVGRVAADEGQIQMVVEGLGQGPLRFRPVASVRGTDVPGKEFIVRP